jgi:hypothetical protein
MEWSPSWEANPWLIKIFSTYYGTWRFITLFTRSPHFSLSSARWIQFAPSQPISVRLIVTLSSYLCVSLPSGLFPSAFSTITHYVFLFSTLCAKCPTSLIPLAVVNGIMLYEYQRTSGIARFHGSWGEWSQSQPLTKIVYFQKNHVHF